MSDIEKLRDEMEKITADMLKLLKSRTDIAKEIGNLKNQQGRVVTDESREDELRNKMMKACDEIGFDQTRFELKDRFISDIASFILANPELLAPPRRIITLIRLRYAHLICLP